MVQTALALLSHALSSLLPLVVPVALGLGLLLAAWMTFSLLDRGKFQAAARRVGRRSGDLGRWALVPLALGVSVLAVGIAHRSVETRFGNQLNARYTNSADPNTSETIQQGPEATYLTERTYTRTLVIPPELLRQVRREGVQVLAPYLQDPTSSNIVRLTDRFTRNGQDVVFSRRATLQTQEFITLDTSRVRTGLNFVGAGGRDSHYNASFEAQYSFHSPLSTPATVRFAFPLPSGSGTLSDFSMTVNGQPYTAADLSSGGSVWEGLVQPGARVEVRVRYRHQGARGWNYDLSQRREPVRNFDLSIQTDQPARFQRYSLFPTSIDRSPFGGAQTLHWQLQNAITAQNVAVGFAQVSVRETLTKLYSFLPLGLTLGALMVLAWAGANRRPVSPLRLGLALLGLGLGFGFGGVLTGYLVPLAAELTGAALGLGLTLLALGRRLWPPLVLTVLAPLTFLSVGNAGLLLGLLAATALVLLLARIRPTPPRPSGLGQPVG